MGVIFCGTTYLSRLWCIVEIFTFVHMGGKVDRIKLVPLTRSGHEHEDEAAIKEAFDHFDAEQCECSYAEDKDRMLTIIRAAFGDMIGFNNAVRDIIEQAGFSTGRRAIARSRSTRTFSCAELYCTHAISSYRPAATSTKITLALE